MKLQQQISEALVYLRSQCELMPAYGIILGTGLGNLRAAIETFAEIPYAAIPHFPVSTVAGHEGKLIFGNLEGIPVVCMAGRFHYYEGYSMKQLTFPVRVMAALGIRRLYISNAAGSTNPNIPAGSIVLIRDHINMQPDNPLRGENDESVGPRFPDMVKAYDQHLIDTAMKTARELDIPCHTGVYVCLAGPNLETPAEYDFLHRIGGDVVGMSTVPEVLVAKHMDLPVMVISIVSNQGYPPEALRETSIEEVIAMAQQIEPGLTKLVKSLILHEESNR